MKTHIWSVACPGALAGEHARERAQAGGGSKLIITLGYNHKDGGSEMCTPCPHPHVVYQGARTYREGGNRIRRQGGRPATSHQVTRLVEQWLMTSPDWTANYTHVGRKSSKSEAGRRRVQTRTWPLISCVMAGKTQYPLQPRGSQLHTRDGNPTNQG